MRKITGIIVLILTVSLATISAWAADATVGTGSKSEYYASTAYELLYGSQYNYGGINAVEYYGSTSVNSSYLSAISGDTAISAISYDAATPHPEIWTSGSSQKTSYTPYTELLRSDGSIGTLKIPSLDISVKVYEGTGSVSMSKGVGHFSDTSSWLGNIGICGHNRGAKYNIGTISKLKLGDTITYTTELGKKTYKVCFVGQISNTDWSYLSATADNRITLITCVANKPSLRVCVQAAEV